jgi:hypothetical protein
MASALLTLTAAIAVLTLVLVVLAAIELGTRLRQR